jgi:glycerophosphoryl diester phosphodiesterase
MQNQKNKKMIKKFLLPLFSLPIIMLSGQDLPDKGICAHRGASFSHPENTISAFKEAIDLGVQMIEFDVRLTCDSILVILHDTELIRTTGINAKVNEVPFMEVRKLDAGLWKDKKFFGEKIPTLEEVLDLIPRNIWMNIHIKGEKEIAIKTARLLKKRDQLNNAILALDAAGALEEIRKIDSRFIICCMDRKDSPQAYVNEAIRIDADFIQLTLREMPFLDVIIPQLKNHNIKINFYFADEIELVNKLFDSGVNFVLVNDVKNIMSKLKKDD